MRFNPPPNWPVPPGWSPGAGRQVDPSWPTPPVGWQFWIAEEESADRAAPTNERIGPPAESTPPSTSVGDTPPRWSPTILAGAAAALVAVAAIATWAIVGRSSPNPDAAQKPVLVSVPTVLILDASGSMNEADAPGPRIEAAKNAATALIDALPDDATLGLETYGTGTGSSDAERGKGCRDVRILAPLGQFDREVMHSTINGLHASGYTPISLALQRAAAQLPTDDSAQAIVLVSDGEDTCDSNPCETAAQLKTAHPELAISTVGFKTDGQASDQLACIASRTGGVFVQAANANQLAARLMATQNINAANNSLTSTGMGGIELGTKIGDIRAAHPDFPDAAPADRVTVVWRDCDYDFTNGTLDAIRPHNGGRTIDGLAPGSPISKATELYGQSLADTTNNGGTTTVIYEADASTDFAYRITVDGNRITPASVIKSITLCRCKPHSAPALPEVRADTIIRSMTFPPGTCRSGDIGWDQSAPITVTDGKGEARTPSGQFGGASIEGAKLSGAIDADGDGRVEALISFTCFGSPFDQCCAGRSSMMRFARVFDFSNPSSPKPIGETIVPGVSMLRGKSYGEPRRIDDVRIDGSAIITDEKLIYADTSDATAADLGYPPNSTVEVTHRFVDGNWVSTERVLR